MLQINIKSPHYESILIYKLFLQKILKSRNITHKSFFLPVKKKRITVLKSPHVNKSAREQFEFKNYKCAIFIKKDMSMKEVCFFLINKPKTIKINIKNLGR